MFRVSLGIPSRFAPAARSPLNRPQTLDRIARKGAQVPTRPVERGSVRLGATDGQGKMYVPSDSFGGLSPERKASNALRTLFTFVAVRVVLAQMEGSGRGALGSYNADQYAVLMEHLEAFPMRDGDDWLEALMIKNKMLGVRIAEVRAAYAETDFEWDQVRRLSVTGTKEANVTILRKTLTSTTSLDKLAEGKGDT